MGDIYPRFTVAAVQAASVLYDRDKTIDKAVRLICLRAYGCMVYGKEK